MSDPLEDIINGSEPDDNDDAQRRSQSPESKSSGIVVDLTPDPEEQPPEYDEIDVKPAPKSTGRTVQRTTPRRAPESEQTPVYRITMVPSREEVTEEVLRKHPELDPEHIAQIGFLGWLNSSLNQKFAPGAAERQNREHSLTELVDGRLTELRRQQTRDLVNRGKPRTHGQCGFFSVISEKGGIGKSTLAALLAYEFSELRKDSVGVADLNPDKGNIIKKFGVHPSLTIRDLVENSKLPVKQRRHLYEFLEKVPGLNVHILGGETNRSRREKTGRDDVIAVFRAMSPYLSISILDNGTGISHPALDGSLTVSHGAVIIIDNTQDAEDYVESTLDYLKEHRKFHGLLKRVIVVINGKVLDVNNSGGDGYVTPESLKAKFENRVRLVETLPFDPVLANSGTIQFDKLQTETLDSVGRIAAALMDDLIA